MTESGYKPSEHILRASANARWAATLVTRWTMLESKNPELWQRENDAKRQLVAGMSELKMYAGDEFRSVPYSKAVNAFKALVKENLKEMGFGT